MIENRHILIKRIQGKWHYFVDVAKVPLEHIDMYVEEIEELMRQHKPEHVHPHIMATWSLD